MVTICFQDKHQTSPKMERDAEPCGHDSPAETEKKLTLLLSFFPLKISTQAHPQKIFIVLHVFFQIIIDLNLDSVLIYLFIF